MTGRFPTCKLVCTNCWLELRPKFSPPGGPSQPCPKCGANKHAISADFGDVAALPIEVRGRILPTTKRQRTPESRRRYAFEDFLTMGESADGPRRSVCRKIDRQKDRYEETVTDLLTGEVIYHTREPLTCHVNRGSAKRRTYRDAVSWALDTITSTAREAGNGARSEAADLQC
jgi:hypothetical protein